MKSYPLPPCHRSSTGNNHRFCTSVSENIRIEVVKFQRDMATPSQARLHSIFLQPATAHLGATGNSIY